MLAVWQAIPGDGGGTDDPEGVLPDPRVVHLYDRDVDIGRWFGDRDGEFHVGSGLAWDAFLLFDTEATFATLADHLETSGGTIIAERGKLSDAFAPSG